MSSRDEEIQVIAGKTVVKAEWTGSLSIDDDEGYLLTFDDGSQVLFSWYQAYDCIGVLHEIRAQNAAAKPCTCNAYQLENYGCKCQEQT